MGASSYYFDSDRAAERQGEETLRFAAISQHRTFHHCPMILKTMSQLCTFANVRMSLPNGWADVSNDMPEGSPPTLAKAEGVGALQFSVGRYRSGANPQVSPDDLDALLKKFADTRSLGLATDVERGRSATHYVGGSFLHDDELIRAWYLTNGFDVALVTYVAAAASCDAAAELLDAGAIVRSIEFE